MTSKKTQHYDLPLYIATDRIDPILDFNGAMRTIDAEMYQLSISSGDATGASAEALEKASAALDAATKADELSQSNNVMINGLKQFEDKVNTSLDGLKNPVKQLYITPTGSDDPGVVDLQQAIESELLRNGDIITIAIVGSSGVPFWSPLVVYFSGDNNYQLFDIAANVLTAIDDYKIREVRVVQAIRY